MDQDPITASRGIARPVALDIFERAVVVLLFARFVENMARASAGKVGWVTLLLIISEALPAIFILCRRFSAAVSRKFSDWLLGLLGATTPLLATPVAAISLAPPGICAVIMLAGLFLQIAAKVSLGSSFGLVAANRGVKVIGPYRFVRHPMYAGYMLSHIGFLLAYPSWWNAMLYSTESAIQVARLIKEEQFLSQDLGYRAYATRVRFRLIPAIF
jgi:protein-S-isoprenylcysteine O-methyltransferase Ste14